jgi:hypothetical protein
MCCVLYHSAKQDEYAGACPNLQFVPNYYNKLPISRPSGCACQYVDAYPFEAPCLLHVPSGVSGHAVVYLVEALCYKPEGRGFDSR